MRAQQPVRWPAEDIWLAVEPLLPGFTVEVLPSIDSTSTELMRRARAGRAEPTLLVAEAQTAGRGRMGRPWQSQAEGTEAERTGALPSLMFSLGLPLAPADWSGLSLAVGVSVAESLQPVLPAPGGAAPRIGLKWPNDLWLDGDRKLGGILVETASFVAPQAAGTAGTGPGVRYVVVGIGINLLPRPGDGMNTPPASLSEVDPALDAPAALARIAAPLVATLQAFERHGFAPVQPRFARRDVLAGRNVTLSDGQAGSARGVAADGALQVKTPGGLQAVTSSEISVRPAGQALPRP